MGLLLYFLRVVSGTIEFFFSLRGFEIFLSGAGFWRVEGSDFMGKRIERN